MALAQDSDEVFDIYRGSIEPSKEALGYELSEHLLYKGYCVIDSGIGFEELDIITALDEAKENLDTRFDPLPSEVVDGILGDNGTGLVAELSLPHQEDAQEDGKTLCKLDTFMTDILHGLAPHMGSMGISASQRTAGMVIQGGHAAKQVPLTEKLCAKWLNVYLRQKLMVLFFLGPGEGILELQPYDGESTPEEITTKPGTVVVVRSDSIGCQHFTTGESFTLATYALGPNLTGGRGARNELKGLCAVNKTIEALQQWAMNKVLDIKVRQVADGELATWNDDTPRGWERAMNHIYHIGAPVAVRGVAGKLPISHVPENFWSILSGGTDLAVDVPIARWDHSFCYNPEPESYKQSNFFNRFVTNVRHGGFMDGLDLFDAKLFSVSPAEAKGMDPQQRLVLETSYESLHMAGFNKKQLMNAYIGVFGGSTNPEFCNCEIECGALSGTGCSEAIFCNRVSFCLGMQGPSTTIDCEMASASCAIYVACAQVAPANTRRGMAGLETPASLASGGYCMMVPHYWPRFNYWMNPAGRCMVYDENAAGYVRGECVGTLCIKPWLDKVDGQSVMSEDDALGIPVGYRMNNNGKNSSMQAPSAPSEQESINEILRQTRLSYLDIDAVEAHGNGNLLHDAVEIGATSKALRGKAGGDGESLMISSSKSNTGAPCEACGITQAFRVMFGQLRGVNICGQHLKTLNPHIDFEHFSVQLNTEAMSFRTRSSYQMQIARGFGGTNCNITWWNRALEEKCSVQRPSLQQENFAFWPAGGGALEYDAQPQEGYTIVGSWSDWSTGESLHQETDTCFSAIVTLGASCCESFQIWIDGDPGRVLHPGQVAGGCNSAVIGPAEDPMGCCWTIDDRSACGPDGELWGGTGAPGDQYCVRLHVSGKWRTVTWFKVGFSVEDAMLATEGKYYVSGSWVNYNLREMTPDPDSPGTHTIQVKMAKEKEYFQILHNMDWGAVFGPPAGEPTAIFGPSPDYGEKWMLSGKVGDRIKIKFSRVVELGVDNKSISWEKV